MIKQNLKYGYSIVMKDLKRTLKIILIILPGILIPIITHSKYINSKFIKIAEYNCPEAHQGVAVDDSFFYAIGTREIGKYEKNTGKLVKKWREKQKRPVIHLDSGVIFDGKLYAAHSNYPGLPMTSSVEIWDTATMEHVGTHSFGIQWGSCTWIDRTRDYWWAVFAHYDKYEKTINKDNSWTTLVKFDNRWQVLESWIFPDTLLQKFKPMSNSGGSWGPDGNLYCTGHDAAEIYVLKLPAAGSILELDNILPVDIQGQGIAWDRSEQNVLYTIKRKEKKVIIFGSSKN